MSEHPAIWHPCPLRRVGSGSHHHFYGYYNKHPWDRSGRYLLAQRVPMMTAYLTGAEVAEVGYFDLQNADQFTAVGETTTWNWQMGSQLQWLGDLRGSRLVYNSRAASSDAGYPYADFRATVIDADTLVAEELPLPVYVVAPTVNGRFALIIRALKSLIRPSVIERARPNHRWPMRRPKTVYIAWKSNRVMPS